MTLIYVPLESYKERYSCQLSAPKVGWYERNWIKAGVEYKRIEPSFHNPNNQINAQISFGQVLDAKYRCRYAMSQIDHMLCFLNLPKECKSEEIKDSDVILFDDFFHPGIESLPYVFHQLRKRPRMYAYCWAQSVDEFDFTYEMRDWMRHFERGIGKILDGIFVANTLLKDKLIEHGIAPANQIHVVGLPFDSEEVMSRMPAWRRALSHNPTGVDPACIPRRENRVVFSSRWDKEKDPGFFLKVMAALWDRNKIPDLKAVICTSAKELRSNDQDLLGRLNSFRKVYPHIEVKTNLTKEEYYAELCRSKIQFNCADQDFVSFTLLEASVAGCVPVYPYFRSFPETFTRKGQVNHQYMYQKGDVHDAVNKLELVMNVPSLWSPEVIEDRSWIHKRMDLTWFRMLRKMGVPWDAKAMSVAQVLDVNPYQ